MKKVFQTIIAHKTGNCMQATVASLLSLKLEEVPHFITYDNWWERFEKFMEKHGYQEGKNYYGGDDVAEEFKLHNLTKHHGIDGCFYASVGSPKFHKEGGTHAIVVDKDMQVVHDPNPNYQDFKYPISEYSDENGIRQVWVFEKMTTVND